MPDTAYIFWALAGTILLFLGGFVLVSIIEGEKRAAAITAALALAGAGLFTLAGLLPASLRNLILALMIGAIILGIILFLLPAKPIKRLRDISSKRFDERDIMFARARLKPGSETYKSYYAMRPENEASDNLFRAQPGLLSPRARNADPVIFAVPNASFTLTEAMHCMVDGEPTPEIAPLPENP